MGKHYLELKSILRPLKIDIFKVHCHLDTLCEVTRLGPGFSLLHRFHDFLPVKGHSRHPSLVFILKIQGGVKEDIFKLFLTPSRPSQKVRHKPPHQFPFVQSSDPSLQP
ncbi:108aa long hypothetical protein [Pyrococcus horikoshii OT3]|uniref:Uncharacterized protein n=1 Tax=Pyrococcus horikoshii (strain ATCC 700860 / DSM 12428 / JCM 9974 / NBRC 100139 / OT-3) TaxID=70601 RepID=O57780_PYRHO|nr:108aa long hypothetical protein [Pyrococcus horikoshii OT3]